VGYWGSGAVGRRGKVGQWVVGERASGSYGKGLVGRGEWGSWSQGKVGQWAEGRGAVREGESIPRRMGRPPGVSGGKRGRRGREGREEVPVHVAQTDPLSRGKELRVEVTIHVAQMGTLLLDGAGEEGGLGVVSEDTLPRCTEGHRLLTRRAGRGGSSSGGV
jgi:hypothetical protein